MGGNIIHIALLGRDERAKRIIIKAQDKGVDINSQNKFGQTPLMVAIKNLITARHDDEIPVDLSIIKFILDLNPDINIQDKNNQTAFHFACMSKSTALLALIFLKQPNIFIQDVKGKRASDYLKTEEMKELYRKNVNI